jgi:Tol biopolymer transport system component
VDIKPIGIDQTTGQQRTLNGADNVTNNIGNTVELFVSQIGDYSNLANNLQTLYPWGSGQKLSNPTTLPNGDGFGPSWSPNGEYLAVGFNGSSPYFYVYQRTGTTLNKLSDPSTVPGGNGFETAWSPDGQFLAVCHAASPFFSIYQRDGNTFTKLPDPASLPPSGSQGRVPAWSPNGEFLVITSTTIGPYLHIYQRNDTTFTRLDDPTTLPSGQGNGADWSPDGRFFAIGHTNSPYMGIYERTGSTEFTRLTDPTSLPTGSGGQTAWSPDGNFLAVAHGTSPYLSIYLRTGTSSTSFVRLDDPSSLPTGDGLGAAWSPNGEYLYISHVNSPYITGYQRNGSTFTAISSLDTLPTGTGRWVEFSNDSQFLAVGHTTSPYLSVYQTATSLPDSGVVIAQSDTLDFDYDPYEITGLTNQPVAQWVANQGTTLSGSDVISWVDRINSNDAQPISASNRPSLNSSDLNGHNTMSFDSAQPEWLLLSSDLGIQAAEAVTIMVLCTIADTTDNKGMAGVSDSTGSSLVAAEVRSNEQARCVYNNGFATNAAISDATNLISQDTWTSLLAAYEVGGNVTVQVNGNLAQTTSVSATTFNGLNQFSIGGWLQGSATTLTRPHNGKIVEVIVWATDISGTGDEDTVRAHWQSLYGVSVS